ncbi:MAG: NUDIX hydrolase [Anaerovoracaceae bacterium]
MTHNEKTISSEMIYEGKVLNLRRDKVTVRDNKTGYREIIEHNGGALVVAITKENNLVLVKQFRKAVEKDILELPAGKREKGEDPLETITRELREETGYTAGKIEELGGIYPSVGYTSEELFIYLATELTPGETDFDESEAIDIYEIPFDEAVQMVIDGRINDGKSVAGILLAEKKLKKNQNTISL